MQRLAIDKNRKLIAAIHAEKQCDYYCRECGAAVRLRRGLHRTTHFFHLKDSRCRQGGKSQIHLQVQEHLQKILGETACCLEKQFPQIGRIADVVWEDKKIIFEIQCSGITREEMTSRNADYAYLGYQVVWILHDRLYNRRKMTPVELYLRNWPHYFSNIDVSGKGGIYDQMDIISGHKRHVMQKFFEIQWNEPHRKDLLHLRHSPAPSLLKNRASHWPLYFSGDLFDSWMQGKRELFETGLPEKESGGGWRAGIKAIGRYYRIIFELFLEKACR